MKAFFHPILTAALLFAVPAAVADELPDSVRQRPVYPIEEVVVTGTRNETDVRLLPMTVSVVDRAAIERSGRQSLLPILTEQVPGLFATARGIMGYGVSTGAAGGMSLRGIGGAPQAGLPTTGLLVLIDGHPQYMGLMGHPIADAYQSMLAERVEVVRGPASVLYGSNAMGGVINIVTRKQREEGIRTDLQAAYGSYNTLQTELSNRIRKGRFTSVVTGSYNRTDGHRADMGFEQYGGYAKLGYELSRAWTLSGDVNLTHFNASNPGEVTAPLIDNDSRITRGRASAALANRYDRTSGALSLFYNWGRHKIDDGYAAGSEPLDYRFNSRDRMLGVSWYQSAQLFAGNRLTVGFDYFHFGGESWNRFLDGHEEPQVDKTQDEVAGYVDFRQSLGTWLTLDAGLRVDRHSHVGTEWVPQAGVSFHLPRSAEIKLSAGKGFRYPTIRELYMFRPANPDLRPERLWSYELSLSQRLWEGRLSYGVNLFYIDGENLILRMPVDGRQMNVNTGRIENAGVEAEIAYRISAAWSIPCWPLPNTNSTSEPPSRRAAGRSRRACNTWRVSTLRSSSEGRAATHRKISSCGTCAQVSASRANCVSSSTERTCWRSVMRSTPDSPCRVQPCWAVWTCTFNELLEIPELSFNHS